MAFKTLEYTDGVLRLIDQRLLPLTVEYVERRTPEEVGQALLDMVVRGAPALGIAAAYGLAMGARGWIRDRPADRKSALDTMCDAMAKIRPTAVNLMWAVERIRKAGHSAISEGADDEVLAQALETEAETIHKEDAQANRKMGAFGEGFLEDGCNVLTHCNAGALATSEYGTALGVVRAAVSAGKKIHVWADETRPFLQGARLTTWELMEDNIDVTLITDNMAGHLMKLGKIDCVVVGADRVAVNGDVANKIGSYSVAILAKYHNLPFYIAAPTSTIDLACPDGSAIPIEERPEEEVVCLGGRRIAPLGVKVANPAFDVVPAELIAAIITERGLAQPPNRETIAKVMKG